MNPVPQRLPWSPEPLETLRARLTEALARTWKLADRRENDPSPGTDRKHVCDVLDEQLRLIIGVEHWPRHGRLLHVSIGAPDIVQTHGAVIKSQKEFLERSSRVVHQLLGAHAELPPVFSEFTNKALHLWFKL